MILKTDNYEFWADIQASHDDDVDIFVGNPNGSPRPCVVFTKYGRELVLQDVVYYSTCSAPTALERGSGTVEMIRGACKAIMERFPDIDKVCLCDKSYFPGRSRRQGNVPLPEVNALVHGATWYQRHFGAVPDIRTVRVLNPYVRIRDQPASPLLTDDARFANVTVAQFVERLDHPDEETVVRILDLLRLKRLTGTSWEIPRASVMQYPVDARFVDDDLRGGGFFSGFRRTKASRPYRPGRVRTPGVAERF